MRFVPQQHPTYFIYLIKISQLLIRILVVLNKVVMVSKNLSGIKDLTGLALPILGLPKVNMILL